MAFLLKLAVPVVLLLSQSAALADPWKDESGHGKKRDRDGYSYRYENDGRGKDHPRNPHDHEQRYGGKDERGAERREFKETYVDGHCKVERKLEKNGEYKEERKCRGARPIESGPPRRSAPLPPLIYEDRSSGFPGAVPDPDLVPVPR